MFNYLVSVKSPVENSSKALVMLSTFLTSDSVEKIFYFVRLKGMSNKLL